MRRLPCRSSSTRDRPIRGTWTTPSSRPECSPSTTVPKPWRARVAATAPVGTPPPSPARIALAGGGGAAGAVPTSDSVPRPPGWWETNWVTTCRRRPNFRASPTQRAVPIRERARCVPDRRVMSGIWRVLTDNRT